MPVDGRSAWRQVGWLLLLPALVWAEDGVAPAADVPDTELLEFLGGFASDDMTVVDMIIDEETGEAVNLTRFEDMQHD